MDMNEVLDKEKMFNICPVLSSLMMLPGKLQGSAEIKLIPVPCIGDSCKWKEKCDKENNKHD